jgi:hypothetical protein
VIYQLALCLIRKRYAQVAVVRPYLLKGIKEGLVRLNVDAAPPGFV